MIRPLAVAQATQDGLLFVATVRWDDDRDRLADGLLRPVSENPLGTAIPGLDDSVQVLADDRVVRIVDDGCQTSDGLRADGLLRARGTLALSLPNVAKHDHGREGRRRHRQHEGADRDIDRFPGAARHPGLPLFELPRLVVDDRADGLSDTIHQRLTFSRSNDFQGRVHAGGPPCGDRCGQLGHLLVEEGAQLTDAALLFGTVGRQCSKALNGTRQ
jgi:hypothetical protein